jgi:hypothetical protein
VIDSGRSETYLDVTCIPVPPAMRVTGDAVSRAQILFHVLQDRHVPMTQTLATSLADFECAQSPAADPFWGQAYSLAGGAIGLHGKMGNTPAWSRLFGVFVQTVAEPILREVAVRMKHVTITTVGGVASAAEAADMGRRSLSIEEAVSDMLNDQNAMGQAFWIGAATTLLGRFRETPAAQSSPSARRGKAVPFLPDLTFAHLVYAVEPILEEDRSWTKNEPRSASKSKRLRVGIRPREGGVTGVQHSRRYSEIADALSSAFILPKEIRLIKLLEEGFMIPRRPPYRRPDRDLLSMTFQDPALNGLEAGALVKAAWIDATTRLRFLLANMSMGNSEIGFGHIHAAGTIASAISAQVDQPRGAFNIMALEGAMRARMISMSALIPSIFDTVVPRDEAARKNTPANPKVAAQKQVRLACAAQVVAGMATQKHVSKNSRTRRPNLGDYAQVCLIDVSPRVVRGDEIVASDWRSNRKALQRDYNLDGAQDLYLGRILCPHSVKPGAIFVLCSDDGAGERDLGIPLDDAPDQAIAQTVGALSSWLITQNIRAIANV